MNSVTYNAFGDELTKIAGVGGTLKSWVAKGWKDVGGSGAMGGWGGKAGTWRSKLPIGGKSLTVGFGAAALPGIMAKRDPMGMERSRTERAAGYSGMTLGGLAGTGALLSAPGKSIPVLRNPLLRSIGGAVLGGLVGERLSTLPWRKKREAEAAALQNPIQDPSRRTSLLNQAAATQALQR